MKGQCETEPQRGARWLLTAVALAYLGFSVAACGSVQASRQSTPDTTTANVTSAASPVPIATIASPPATAVSTAPVPPSPATPISSAILATATAFSPTAIPTAAPATPAAPSTPTSSPSPSPTLVPPTTTPALGLADQVQALLTFMNSDAGNQARLAQWIADRGLSPGQPPDYGETQKALTSPVEADLDGDGDSEIVLSLWQQSEGILPLGTVLILDQANGQYRLAYQAGTAAAAPDTLYSPALLKVEDINGDSVPEVLYTSTDCGAHTCFLTIWGVAWHGTGYTSLFPRPPSMAYPVLSLTDTNGDSKLEIVLKGGVIGSVGAGLQRERTEVYAWRNGQYELASTAYEPSPYLYFKIMDANEALAKGDYERAISLYHQALTDDELLAWKPMMADDKAKEAEVARKEIDGLRAFALFRLLQVQGLAGDKVAARQALADLHQRYPTSALGEAGDHYWQRFEASSDPVAACAEAQPIIEAHPEVLEPLNGYGYANPDFSAVDICYRPASAP